MIKNYLIHISGQVQGVGFRPFVFNLAREMRLKGFVSNDANGAVIHIQGEEADIERFISDLQRSGPANSHITNVSRKQIPPQQLADAFFIKPSPENIVPSVPLTPDFATCINCANEISDPQNRRYFYPFTTCTQCGPRYAATVKYPFERENTSVSHFGMCPDCRREYVSPGDIRFHSQTNSCPLCGVKMRFADNRGNVLEQENKAIFDLLAQKLKEGKIVAAKNTSGYLLLCDATNEQAVTELRNRKMRPHKPFAVLFPSIEEMSTCLALQDIHRASFLSPESPINIIPVKNKNQLALSRICPGMNRLGAMYPYTGILKLIAKTFGKPFVATSGNLHNAPICSAEAEAGKLLQNIADYFLHHDLDITHPQDDSVIEFSPKHHRKIILRRARGLAPNCAFDDELQSKNTNRQKILCLGSDLKNSFAIVPNNHCYLSEYIGDLANYDTFLRHEKTIRSYQHIFSFNPTIILSDKHPLFQNTLATTNFPTAKRYQIQHHEAHFAAILGEHRLWENHGNVLGVVWDGMGFLSENEIWGGEFFIYHQAATAFRHVAQFRKFAWILGDKMAQSPKIAALAISANNECFNPFFAQNEWTAYTRQILKKNVQTSSAGRLFDAVSFVLGFEQNISFEGQAAMHLEKLARSAYTRPKAEYTDYLSGQEIRHTIPTRKLLMTIVREATRRKPETIALNFHYTLIKAIEKIATLHRAEAIAFSGGVFQNAMLVDLAIDILGDTFELFFHENISPNDENIAFGQLNYYLNIISKNEIPDRI